MFVSVVFDHVWESLEERIVALIDGEFDRAELVDEPLAASDVRAGVPRHSPGE